MAEKIGISAEIYKKISVILVFQQSMELIETLDIRYLWAGYPRKAVLILNPYILDTEYKKREFFEITQIREKDFEFNYSSTVYYDAKERPSYVIASSLNRIVEQNIL